MDQICIDQDDKVEKAREVPKMRKYYSNAAVTLVAINCNIDENKDLDFVVKSDEKTGNLGKLIEKSLPILEKIITSE